MPSRLNRQTLVLGDAAYEADTDVLGMWVFLASEWLVFGGLFVSYAAMRYLYPDAFAAMAERMDLTAGTVNTAILLTSSLAAAIAADAAKRAKRKAMLWSLLVTLALGVVFEAIKGYEYAEHFREGAWPRAIDVTAAADLRKLDVMLWLYYVMTGLHALHVAIGIGVFAVITWRWWRRSHRVRPGGVEIAALYWHFVDTIWVFLYPLIYLGSHRG